MSPAPVVAFTYPHPTPAARHWLFPKLLTLWQASLHPRTASWAHRPSESSPFQAGPTRPRHARPAGGTLPGLALLQTRIGPGPARCSACPVPHGPGPDTAARRRSLTHRLSSLATRTARPSPARAAQPVLALSDSDSVQLGQHGPSVQVKSPVEPGRRRRGSYHPPRAHRADSDGTLPQLGLLRLTRMRATWTLHHKPEAARIVRGDSDGASPSSSRDLRPSRRCRRCRSAEYDRSALNPK